MGETAPFVVAGGMSCPEEGVFHKLRMCQEPRLSWMPPGIWGVWDKDVWVSSVTGPGGYKTAGFMWGLVAHPIPVPEGRFPRYRALYWECGHLLLARS